MKFEINGYKIYDEDYDLIGDIYQDDPALSFVVSLEGVFSKEELKEIIGKIEECNND